MARVLIIGYGNSLRMDDGAGLEAAEHLAAIYTENPNVRVMAAHQLTPEMAQDMAGAEFVLLLDAAMQGAPGTIAAREIVAAPDGGLLAHHCAPEALLATAKSLYGRTPSVMSLTLTGASFELGTELSPLVHDRMAEFVEAARQTVSQWQQLVAESGTAQPTLERK